MPLSTCAGSKKFTLTRVRPLPTCSELAFGGLSCAGTALAHSCAVRPRPTPPGSRIFNKISPFSPTPRAGLRTICAEIVWSRNLSCAHAACGPRHVHIDALQHGNGHVHQTNKRHFLSDTSRGANAARRVAATGTARLGRETRPRHAGAGHAGRTPPVNAERVSVSGVICLRPRCSCGRRLLKKDRVRCGQCLDRQPLNVESVPTFISCPHCTSVPGWRTRSCCLCEEKRRVELLPSSPLNVWGKIDCHCQTCVVLRGMTSPVNSSAQRGDRG